MFSLAEYREWILYAGYGLLGVSVFIFVRMLLTEQENISAQENLREQEHGKVENPLLKLTRPFFAQYILPSVRGRASLENIRTEYRRRIITAGLKAQITADELISFKIVLIVFMPLLLLISRTAGLMDVPDIVIFASPVAGFLYPDFWIKGLIQRRHKEVIKSLPFVVDLLALSTEAGLDFIGAIQKVVEKAKPSPLIDELEQVLKEIKVGSSRSEALREMSQRIQLQEIGSFVAVLVSADQMGASIGKVLRQQSDQIRTLRFIRAEKEGGQASQKLMGPLFLFFVPAVMLVLLGPFILQAQIGGGP